MATERKPTIEYYWANPHAPDVFEPVINWRLVGANGEIMCSSTQGFRDKTDARRSVKAVFRLASPVAAMADPIRCGRVVEVGPGEKPR